MPKIACLTGQRVGYLVVLSRGPNDAKQGTQWNCQCDCGNAVLVRGQYLSPSKRGYQQRHCSKKCSLLLVESRSDVTNKRFGQLVGVKYVSSNRNGEAVWQFKCDCGAFIEVSAVCVRRGHTRSCGCLWRNTLIKHGKSDTAEYRTERTRKWRETHPEKAHALSRVSQSARALRAPKWLTEEHKKQMSDLYRLANKLTKETGIEHHVDHIYPLQGVLCSGPHVPWNMRVMLGAKNRQKSNKFPDPEDIVQPDWQQSEMPDKELA